MGENEKVLLREDINNIAYLTLNRPKTHNALSVTLLNSLLKEVQLIESDVNIRVVVIKANGPSFCSGHDLKEIKLNNNSDDHKKLFNMCSKVMLSLTYLPQPVIARVHSTATAAGCQLVASCDLAVSSNNAKFATPGVNIGLFCSTPMVALSRNVSKKQSMEMLLTGELIDAYQAKDFGLINKVCDENDLDAKINEFCQSILSKSAKTIAIGKRAFYKQSEMCLEDAYKYTSDVMTTNILQYDAQEGVEAFLQKRTPVWEK